MWKRASGDAATLLAASLLIAGPASAAAQDLGRTIDVGETGFGVRRPVLAAACPHGCPWGELGEWVRDALAPVGYEVVLCRNCSLSLGPPLVATRAYPPPLDALAYSYDPATVWQARRVPLHPGAERYYRERRYMR